MINIAEDGPSRHLWLTQLLINGLESLKPV